MVEQTTRELYRQYFWSYDLLYLFVNHLPLYFHSKPYDYSKIDSLKKQAIKLAKDIKIDLDIFKKELFAAIRHLERSGARPTSTPFFPRLNRPITNRRKILQEQLQKIPNNPNKLMEALLAMVENEEFKRTDQILDAMVLFQKDISEDLIDKVEAYWNREREEFQARGVHQLELLGIFWTSYDFEEHDDMVSRYRFWEKFNLNSFDSVFLEVVDQLERSLLDMRDLDGAGYLLWLMGRSQSLINKVAGVDVVLRACLSRQTSEGWWSYNINSPTEEIYRKDLYLTAIWSLNLLKLAGSHRLLAAGRKGAEWILSCQNEDGSWSIPKTYRSSELKADVFVTMLCLELLTRSGLKGIEDSLNRGINWIIHQQGDDGLWKSGGIPRIFLNILVYEFLDRIDTFTPKKLSPEKVYRVFLSSTIKDKIEIRQLIKNRLDSKTNIELILSEDAQTFPKTIKDVDTFEASVLAVNEADILILLIDKKYGEINDTKRWKAQWGSEISVTEAEYRQSRKNRIPRVIFIEKMVIHNNELFNKCRGKTQREDFCALLKQTGYDHPLELMNFINRIKKNRLHKPRDNWYNTYFRDRPEKLVKDIEFQINFAIKQMESENNL